MQNSSLVVIEVKNTIRFQSEWFSITYACVVKLLFCRGEDGRQEKFTDVYCWNQSSLLCKMTSLYTDEHNDVKIRHRLLQQYYWHCITLLHYLAISYFNAIQLWITPDVTSKSGENCKVHDVKSSCVSLACSRSCAHSRSMRNNNELSNVAEQTVSIGLSTTQDQWSRKKSGRGYPCTKIICVLYIYIWRICLWP